MGAENSADFAAEVSLLLAYYDAGLALLLRVCQTRLGAAHVLNAGLFQAIHESQIFSADPDIGLGKALYIKLDETRLITYPKNLRTRTL